MNIVIIHFNQYDAYAGITDIMMITQKVIMIKKIVMMMMMIMKTTMTMTIAIMLMTMMLKMMILLVI